MGSKSKTPSQPRGSDAVRLNTVQDLQSHFEGVAQQSTHSTEHITKLRSSVNALLQGRQPYDKLGLQEIAYAQKILRKASSAPPPPSRAEVPDSEYYV